MKKIFGMIAVMLLSAISLLAQNPDKGLSWAVEGGIGTELELGGRAQYNFNKYIAIEGVAKYALDWQGYGTWNEITLQAGARAFSPEFCQKHPMKAFLATDMGYGVAFNDGSWNTFALDVTVGMYIHKGLYMGYGFGGMFNDGKHKDHCLRIGYNF